MGVSVMPHTCATKHTHIQVTGHQLNFGKVSGYMPGNGALLQSVAAMAAGFDGDEGDDQTTPGFPASWNVVSEGLLPLP